MPYRRLAGSDDAVRRAAATGSAGVVVMRREAHANMTHPMQACLARERDWPTPHDDPSQMAANVLERDCGNRGARPGRPHFARLHASIAERRLDWAWQQPAAAAEGAGEGGRQEGRGAATRLSARALWLGGTVFALVAAGIISAIAALQSSRPLPFATWARLDLLQRADDAMGRMTATAVGPDQFAEGEPGAQVAIGTARQEAIAALGRVTAAREHGDVDAALASDARPEPSRLEVAGLGPVLTSAAGAERVAVNLALRSLTTAGGRTGAEGIIAAPPRPVFKPAPASSFPAHGSRPPPRP